MELHELKVINQLVTAVSATVAGNAGHFEHLVLTETEGAENSPADRIRCLVKGQRKEKQKEGAKPHAQAFLRDAQNRQLAKKQKKNGEQDEKIPGIRIGIETGKEKEKDEEKGPAEQDVVFGVFRYPSPEEDRERHEEYHENNGQNPLKIHDEELHELNLEISAGLGKSHKFGEKLIDAAQALPEKRLAGDLCFVEGVNTEAEHDQGKELQRPLD